jgi:phosphotriesterase-related protein
VLGHLDNDLGGNGAGLEPDVDYHRSLADRGCFIQYDTCGNSSYFPASFYNSAYWLPSDRERVAALVQLLEGGYGDRILLSHDVCKKTQLRRYGGLGYGYILREFSWHLREAGVEQRAIDAMLVDNPRRMLAGA